MPKTKKLAEPVRNEQVVVKQPIEETKLTLPDIIIDATKAALEGQLIVTTPFPHKLKKKGGIVHEKTYYHTRVRKNPEVKQQKKELMKKISEKMKMMTIDQLTTLLAALKTAEEPSTEEKHDSDGDDA